MLVTQLWPSLGPSSRGRCSVRPVGIPVSESDDLGMGLPPSQPLSGCVPLSDLTSLTSVSSGKEPVPALGVMM